ncbi:recombinase family protein [Streptomyces yunnanensis]|uniref:Site-specific DNA recombinase n=1 Tax=Streptomyces yunnanensis TaxID=156453 RepID=A0A9X8QRT8_9ACTN|nr:recombinase family protein [Streptomyces yunnanensis]SHL61159.1 Site-specific DNA recombinase [Streptomyces yunnanensis]
MSNSKAISQVDDHSARARKLARMAEPKRVRRSRDQWAGEPAAIYCRISHVNDDDQTGVVRQERICRDLAKRLGLEIARPLVFVDNNRSAWQRSRKRPGWDALLEAARAGGVRHILTYHPDRLMRQPRDLEELLQISDDYDITLHGEANHRDLSDPDDRFFLRIEVAHACRSSDDTSRRLKDALIDRAKDGRPHTGKRRYGYDKSGMQIDPHEAEVVREIFTSYLDGESPGSIAVALNMRGEKTALGKQWNGYNVRAVLDSHHVAGIRVFRGEEIGHGDWPAIIDRGMWDEVRERRMLRASAAFGTNAPKRPYILRGVVICKACTLGMKGSGGKYVCNRSGRNDDQSCHRGAMAEPLEKFVVDAAIYKLKELKSAEQQAATSLSEEDQAAIKADRTELDELRDMWEAQELKTHEYRAMRKTVEERIAKIERKLVVRPTAEVLRGLVGPKAREEWQKLEKEEDYDRMNAVLRFLFRAVIIDKPKEAGNFFDFGRVDIQDNPL